MSITQVDFSYQSKESLDSSSLEGAEAYDYLKDSMGRFRTQSLFWETRHEKYPAPFTLKDQPHEGRVSMYQKYMEIGDPTEYSQAIALLGSWKHWEVLTRCEWFKPYIERWRSELKVKFESDRFREMEAIVKEQPGTTQAIQATKWLAAQHTSSKAKAKRGRPTKDERAAALKEATEEDRLLQEEAERLGI